MLKKLLSSVAMIMAMTSASASQPYEIVIPAPPGASAFTIAQQIRQWLVEDNITSVVVPKPGAQGVLATGHVARQGTDTTLLLLPSGPGLYGPLTGAQGIQYDVLRDFEPIITLGTMPSILVVNADSPYRTANDVVRAARQRDLLWGSGNLTGKVDALRFFDLHGISGTEVPFNGAAPMLTGLASGGQFEFAFTDLGSAKPLLDAGKIRILAVAGHQRSPSMPLVPTFKEQGINFTEAGGWYVLVAKKGISQDQVSRINQVLNAAIRRSKTNVITEMTDPVLGSPEDARRFIENQYRVMQPVASRLRTTN